MFRRDRVDLEQGAWLASGLLCGSLPILLFNLTSDWVNLRYLFEAASAPGEASLEFIWDGITRRFPLFFQGRNVDAYPARVPVLSVIEMAMYLVMVASALVTWLRGEKNPRSLECLVLFHFFFNLGILLTIDRSAQSPRVLPAAPAVLVHSRRLLVRAQPWFPMHNPATFLGRGDGARSRARDACHLPVPGGRGS